MTPSSPKQAISACLQTYREFVRSTAFEPLILRCIFTNAYNHFYASAILSEKGLFTQTYNCLRMGLESEWLGLILVRDPRLGEQWAFGLGEEGVQERLKELEKPYLIRKTLGDTERITVQDRDEIYSALSDKSHTKLSSVSRFFIAPDAPPYDGYVGCIPMGGMNGEENINHIQRCTATILTYALAEIEDNLDKQLLNEKWEWNRANIMIITEAGVGNTGSKVQPHISSKGHPGSDPMQAIALLSAIRHGRI